jgi:hypothetical protein
MVKFANHSSSTGTEGVWGAVLFGSGGSGGRPRLKGTRATVGQLTAGPGIGV